MKKIYTFLSLITAVPLIASCGGNSPSIKIKNKIESIGLFEKEYKLNVEAKHLGSAKLVYTSSATNVADIDDTGLITLFDKGTTTITVASSLNKKINDSFNLEVGTSYIEGTVKDEGGLPIEGVHVSYGNTKTVDTKKDGTYSITVEKAGEALYFEKIGYLTRQYALNIQQVYRTHRLDVVLSSGDLKYVTITGSLVDIEGKPVTDKCIDLTIKKPYNKEYALTKSNNDGTFTFTDVIVGSNVVIETEHNEFNSSATEVEITKSEVIVPPITLEPYQEEMMFSRGEKDLTTGADKMILGHVYRRDLEGDDGENDTLVFNFEATYAAFTENNQYRICIDAGKDKPASPLHTTEGYVEDNNDFDIGFNSKEIIDGLTKHYGGGSFGSGSATVDYISEYQLNVEIPYTYANASGLKANDESPIGVYFDSSLVSATNKCTIYGHSMTEQNQLSYIRVDKDNVGYAATDNEAPESAFVSDGEQLAWQETTPTTTKWRFATYNDSPIIGQVGHNYNYGYQFEIAKRKEGENDLGIYILAKMRMSEMNGYFLEDTWKPNIYIDANVVSDEYTEPTIDEDINRFAMISNYTLERSYPKNSSTPFDNTVPYLNEDVYEKGVRYYTNRDLAIIYLPYSSLRDASKDVLTKEDRFGLALNLNYKKSDWYAFQGANPTGYGDIPHFEDRLSYIHFDKDLNVLTFKRPPQQ